MTANGSSTALLVEDDAAILSLLERFLVRKGMAVTACGSAKEALTAATNGRFHAAVIDVSLPDGNGLEVARRIHALGAAGAVVVCSGLPISESEVGLPPGQFSILQKPFLPNSLWSLIESAMISSSEV